MKEEDACTLYFNNCGAGDNLNSLVGCQILQVSSKYEENFRLNKMPGKSFQLKSHLHFIIHSNKCWALKTFLSVKTYITVLQWVGWEPTQKSLLETQKLLFLSSYNTTWFTLFCPGCDSTFITDAKLSVWELGHAY